MNLAGELGRALREQAGIDLVRLRLRFHPGARATRRRLRLAGLVIADIAS